MQSFGWLACGPNGPRLPSRLGEHLTAFLDGTDVMANENTATHKGGRLRQTMNNLEKSDKDPNR